MELFVTVCIPKYISFNGISKRRAGRNKHYCVLAARTISHITVIKRLKAKIPVRTTRVNLRNQQLLKSNTRCAIQVPTNKHYPRLQRNIRSLFTGASYCQKDIPNTSHCWKEMPFALTAHQQKPAHLTAGPAADIHSFPPSKTTPAALGCSQTASRLGQPPYGAGKTPEADPGHPLPPRTRLSPNPPAGGRGGSCRRSAARGPPAPGSRCGAAPAPC